MRRGSFHTSEILQGELKNPMGIGPGKERVMFGRMMVTPIFEMGVDADLETSITSILRAAELAEIVRRIEFSNSVLLFLLVSGDPESGSVYSLDRKTGTWYSVDFDDKSMADTA
jgi:hypothetical protein